MNQRLILEFEQIFSGTPAYGFGGAARTELHCLTMWRLALPSPRAILAGKIRAQRHEISTEVPVFGGFHTGRWSGFSEPGRGVTHCWAATCPATLWCYLQLCYRRAWGPAYTYAMQGDVPKAKAAYQDFLTLWKDADPDIPIYKQAKAEYAKLQ